MRKLKLQMQMTVDGFVAGPQGELDWMSASMDPKQLHVLQDLTIGMDTIIMGRKMAAGFTQYWEHVVDTQPGSPEYAYAKIFVDTPKIVFSKTEQQIAGRNVQTENGDLVTVVNKLKSQPGKNIIVYGGAHFVSELLANNLVDDLYLFVNPVAIGEGLKIFNGRSALQLVQSTACGNGLVINQYSKKA